MRRFSTIITLVLLVPGMVWAAMASPNYKIQSDVISFGGSRSTSTNFNLEDTAGEVATGRSASTGYKLNAGFWQMQVTYISISAASDVTLSPAINGLTGGVGNGTASWTVVTDNPAGYELYVRANSSPAMTDGLGNSFGDYTPAGTDPDYSWSVPATTSEFGFTPEGVDIVQKYRDDGVNCNTGNLDTQDACWNGFSTSDELVAKRTSSNHPSGTSTTVKFRAESGNQNIQVDGVYTATIIVTVLPL